MKVTLKWTQHIDALADKNSVLIQEKAKAVPNTIYDYYF